jgi:hypothetical protein
MQVQLPEMMLCSGNANETKFHAGGAQPRGTKPGGSLLLAIQQAESSINRYVNLCITHQAKLDP